MSKQKNNVMKYVIEVMILLIIGVVAFYFISKINPSALQTNKKTVTVTFEAQDVEQHILDKITEGDFVSDNVKNTAFGTIKSVKNTRPATRTVADYDNKKFIQAPIEDLFVTDITVDIVADVTDLAIMAGETELKIGYSVPLISEDYLLNSTVTKIEIAE